jgi:hypothetical protein
MSFASTLPKVVCVMFSTSRVVSGHAVAREAAPDFSAVTPAFCFSLLSLPEAGVMARVLEQFAKRGLLPTRWFSDVDCETGLLQIDIQVAGLTAASGEDIGRCLGAVVGIQQVLTGTKSVLSNR